MAQLYQQAKAFIFPSIYEGFGFPPLEAMSFGTPVISSNAACMPEICGDAALYVQPLSIESISVAITQLMNQPALCNTLVSKGYEQIAKFTWDCSINAHINIIDKLLEK